MTSVVKTHKCPICHKMTADTQYHPLCSKRCADVDLGRWLDGSYSMPVQELDESDYEELEKAVTPSEDNQE